jgi:hypothetical protein
MASILYCVEAVTLEKATIVELDRLQCMVGRFILQIPHSSSKVLTWMDAASCLWHTEFRPDKLCSSGVF